MSGRGISTEKTTRFLFGTGPAKRLWLVKQLLILLPGRHRVLGVCKTNSNRLKNLPDRKIVDNFGAISAG
jgi:hypothetical protein